MTTQTSRWNRRGLQVRVLVLVGVGLVASLGIMGGATWLYLNSLGRQMLSERQILAQSVAQHLNYVLEADLETLQGISPVAAAGPARPDVDAERRAALGEATVRARLFDRAFLVDRNGNWISEQPPAVGVDFSPLNTLIKAAQSNGRPAVSMLIATPPGVRRIYALVPLRNWRAEVIAVAVGEIDPAGSRFGQLLAPLQFGANGSVDVVDKSGVVLVSTDKSRYGVKNSSTGDVVVSAAVSDAPWLVTVRQPEQDAFGLVFALDRDIVLLGSLLLALGLLFAWGVARSVRNPVALLTRAAERITDGNLDEPIPALPDDEVGRLGRSLEHMRVALKESIEHVEKVNEELEARVLERTQELERLYQELRAREQWRGQLLARVIGAQEDERKRLARELHDETSQTLNALVMRLETAVAAFPSDASRQRLVEAKDLTVRTLDELHRLIYDLRPSVLDDLGLLSAIRWYAERHLEPLGVGVHWEFSGQERRLQPEIETALFRVMQEAITNIAKYAHAESVLIQCVLKDDAIALEIEDDGDGFDPSSLPATPGSRRGLGLMGMRERVELLGGTIEIDAAPGQGVRIAVAVPLYPEANYV